MRPALVTAALLLVTIGVAASDTGAPLRLADTGLSAPGVRPFSPQYPLWSDGATKKRWVYLPPGASIDDSDPNRWQVPVGTRFWKQFDFNGRKVETRMIWRATRDRWVFASYQWNAEGTEATLAPIDGLPGAAEITPGKQHTIPSVNDCTACHGSERPGPLGFNALQLSPDRDPNAIHAEALGADMVTLRSLIDEGRLKQSGARLLARPPRIATEDPQTRSALGYLVANCGGCHNGRGEISALGPTLKYDELLEDADRVARALVGHPTKWQVPGQPEGQSRLIDPVVLGKSALLVRIRSRSPLSQMPPLGTVVRDTAAMDALTAWAAALARQSHRE
jgi:mono/diheme cytochrome c family protein